MGAAPSPSEHPWVLLAARHRPHPSLPAFPRPDPRQPEELRQQGPPCSRHPLGQRGPRRGAPRAQRGRLQASGALGPLAVGGWGMRAGAAGSLRGGGRGAVLGLGRMERGGAGRGAPRAHAPPLPPAGTPRAWWAWRPAASRPPWRASSPARCPCPTACLPSPILPMPLLPAKPSSPRRIETTRATSCSWAGALQPGRQPSPGQACAARCLRWPGLWRRAGRQG